MSDLLTLNVGGVLYTTSQSTLTLSGDSMLGRMFGGDWELNKDSDGRCFIDRDGHLFRYVLNFLRTGKLIVPEDFPELQQLRSEADFYQIEEMIEAIDYEIAQKESMKPKPPVYRLSQRDYYLDVVESTTISGAAAGTCEKTLILCGNVEVIKSLPIDSQIYRNLLYLFTNYDGTHRNNPAYKSYGVFNNVNCVSSGDSTQIFLKTFRSQANSHSASCALRINRCDLADVLLAAKCTLVTSSSEFSKAHKDSSEFQCSDKWRIPEESLEILANLPKL